MSRRAKFRRVWVGADDEVMKPQPRPIDDQPLTVFFYGTFIPLQGIEHIIDAAALVAREDERIRFVLCGDGQTHAEMRRRARSLALREPRVRASALAGRAGAADRPQRHLPRDLRLRGEDPASDPEQGVRRARLRAPA